jgi:predicted transcriptional regulator
LSTFNSKPINAHAAFRVSKDLLALVEEICVELDLTRSQIFRRSIAEYVKARAYQRGGANDTP